MANDDSMDWQRQSMSKNGSSSAPSQMHSKLMPSDPAAGLHKKIAMPTCGMGGMVSSNAARKVLPRFADGGEVDMGDFKGVDEAVAYQKPVYEDDVLPKPASKDEVMAAAKEDAPAPKKQSFKEAFAENRKAGNSEFEWNGSKFNTKIAGETKAPAAKASAPAPAPVAKASAPSPAPTSSAKTFSEDMAERKAKTAPSVSAAFEQDKINYGDKKVAPQKEREFKMLRGRKVYLDELPEKSAAQKVHPRTGRPV